MKGFELQKLTIKLSLKDSGMDQKQKHSFRNNHLKNIPDFSSFHAKYCTTEKFSFVFQVFSFWQGDWALGYYSMKF